MSGSPSSNTPQTPLTLSSDGLLIEFAQIAAGEVAAQTRVALFLPFLDVDDAQDTARWARNFVRLAQYAYAHGEDACGRGYAHAFDLTAPSFVVWLFQFQIAVAASQHAASVAPLVCVLDAQAAAQRRVPRGCHFRVIMREGDAPALWWLWRVALLDDGDEHLDALGLVGKPTPPTPTRVTSRRRAKKVAPATDEGGPVWTMGQYATLERMRAFWQANTELMARDGAHGLPAPTQPLDNAQQERAQEEGHA